MVLTGLCFVDQAEYKIKDFKQITSPFLPTFFQSLVSSKKTIPPIAPGLTFEASNEVEDGNGSVVLVATELINLNI